LGERKGSKKDDGQEGNFSRKRGLKWAILEKTCTTQIIAEKTVGQTKKKTETRRLHCQAEKTYLFGKSRGDAMINDRGNLDRVGRRSDKL